MNIIDTLEFGETIETNIRANNKTHDIDIGKLNDALKYAKSGIVVHLYKIAGPSLLYRLYELLVQQTVEKPIDSDVRKVCGENLVE